MHAPLQSRVPATVLSSALIAFSIIWFTSAYVFQVANRDSKDGRVGGAVVDDVVAGFDSDECVKLIRPLVTESAAS